ncbi:MAG: hypothetical protein V1789_04220 [PVC group bacterium]
MNEIGIIKILHKYRIRLLIITLAVGALTAAITLLISNKYSASAAISVQRPEVTLTGEIPPLTVETLRSLVESTRVKWDLYQDLVKDGIIREDMDFRRFQEMLSTSVKHDQSRDRLLLPIVTLNATTSDPELSMAVANRWAQVVLQKTKGIYQAGVDDLGTFTTNIFEKVSKSLIENEDQYTEARLKADLTVKQLLLEQNEELYSELSLEVLSLEEQVVTRKALLKQLRENVTGQEIEGSWSGEVFARKLAEDPGYTLPDSAALAGRIARTIRSLRSNEQTLAEFDETSQLNHKYIMVKIKKKQIEDISGETLQARTSLFSLEPTYAKLQEELSKISDKIVLSKAIGDDKLWETYLQGGLKDTGQLPLMKTESSNPIYEETQKEMIRLSGEITGLKNKISKGEQELETLRVEVSKLTREIAPLESQRKNLQNAVNKDQALQAYYEQSYNTDRQELEASEKELARMEVKLAAKKAKLDEVGREIAGLEKIVFTSESQLARQKRDIENLTQVHSSLAAKAEEVALLRVSMENVSRSGTVLLYTAQTDPVKVGPPRTRIILIAMLMAFVLACLLVVLNVLVREE